MKHAAPSVEVVVRSDVSTGLRFDRKAQKKESKIRWMARLVRWWCKFTYNPANAEARKEAGISCFVGLNGSGKTLRAVADIEQELNGVEWECYAQDHFHNDPIHDERGDFVMFGPNAVHKGEIRVLSTVRLLDPETGKLHHRYEKFDDWKMLEKLEHAVLLMDEIAGVAHSRDNSSLPHNIMNLLQQLRKGEVRVVWTAPHWSRADKLIREVTQFITVCEGSYADRGETTLWKPNRKFTYLTYETTDFDEWTAGRAAKLDAVVKEHVWGPGSIGFRLYDTKQKVTRIGHANDAGVCVECSGTRSRQQCSCEDYVSRKRKPARESVAA